MKRYLFSPHEILQNSGSGLSLSIDSFCKLGCAVSVDSYQGHCLKVFDSAMGMDMDMDMDTDTEMDTDMDMEMEYPNLGYPQ